MTATPDPFDALAEAAAAIEAASGVSPVLVGGLAVQLTIMTDPLLAEGPDAGVLPGDDARLLARLPRVTRDIDLGLPAAAVPEARAQLARLGYQPVPQHTHRLERGAVAIDLLPFGPTVVPGDPAGALLLVERFHARLRPAAQIAAVAVCQPALLAVLKAIAWDNRHEPRDAVDLGRLAFGDLVREGAAADMVQDIAALLPPWVRATLVRTAGALGQPGAGPAAAFVAAVADHLGGLAAGTHEDQIRNAFSVAVARMLVR